MPKLDLTKPKSPRFSKATKRLAAIGLVVGMTAAGYTAVAMWTNHTEPHAHGTMGTAHALTSTATVLGESFPGYCNDIKVDLTNNTNPVTVRVAAGSKIQSLTSDDADLQSELTADNTVVASRLLGTTLKPGQTVSIVIPGAACVSQDAPDHTQGKSYDAAFFIPGDLVTGNGKQRVPVN